MNQEYQERIDLYLSGQMADDERLLFESQLCNDNELREQFDFSKNVRAAIISRNENLAKIREWEKAYFAKKESVRKRVALIQKKRVLYWASGIAALLIAGFFVYNSIRDIQNGGTDSFGSIGYGNIRTGVDNDSIIQLLDGGDYATALKLIAEREDELVKEQSQLTQQESDMDSEEYSYMQNACNFKLDELHWLKVHVLIGLGQKDDALNLLEEMRQKEGYYKLQADSLYKVLKK